MSQLSTLHVSFMSALCLSIDDLCFPFILSMSVSCLYVCSMSLYFSYISVLCIRVVCQIVCLVCPSLLEPVDMYSWFVSWIVRVVTPSGSPGDCREPFLLVVLCTQPPTPLPQHTSITTTCNGTLCTADSIVPIEYTNQQTHDACRSTSREIFVRASRAKCLLDSSIFSEVKITWFMVVTAWSTVHM